MKNHPALLAGICLAALCLLGCAPNPAEDHYNRGLANYKKGLYGEAIAEFNNTLAIEPQNAAAYNSRGLALGEKGLLDEAIADFGSALAISPQNAEVHYNKALACEKAGRSSEALEAYQVFIRFASPRQYASQIRSARQRIQELNPVQESVVEERRLEGWVENNDGSALTIKTAMGDMETLFLDAGTAVSRKGEQFSVDDVKPGESVSLQYVSLPDMVVVRSISMGYTVSYCSCGSSCQCPLSRGCRVIRY